MTDDRMAGPSIADQRLADRIPDEPERISDDPGRPDDVILGAPGAMLVIISGPSGVGKDTIIDVMRERETRTGRTGERHYVVTVTTRAPRDGEIDGVDYHFVTREEFLRHPRRPRLPRGERGARQLVRLAARPGARARSPAGRDAILKIDVQGAQIVKEQVTEALLIFVIPPSLETLFSRLRTRATESADELELRQRNAAIELARQDDYDHVVVNETGQVERTAERIDAIIAEERRLHADRRVRV